MKNDREALAEKAVTGSELASIVGVTGAQISKLAKRGTIPRLPSGQYPLALAVQAYIAHASRQGEPSQLEQARAALYEARRLESAARLGALRASIEERVFQDLLVFFATLRTGVIGAARLAAHPRWASGRHERGGGAAARQEPPFSPRNGERARRSR